MRAATATMATPATGGGGNPRWRRPSVALTRRRPTSPLQGRRLREPAVQSPPRVGCRPRRRSITGAHVASGRLTPSSIGVGDVLRAGVAGGNPVGPVPHSTNRRSRQIIFLCHRVFRCTSSAARPCRCRHDNGRHSAKNFCVPASLRAPQRSYRLLMRSATTDTHGRGPGDTARDAPGRFVKLSWAVMVRRRAFSQPRHVQRLTERAVCARLHPLSTGSASRRATFVLRRGGELSWKPTCSVIFHCYSRCRELRPCWVSVGPRLTGWWLPANCRSAALVAVSTW